MFNAEQFSIGWKLISFCLFFIVREKTKTEEQSIVVTPSEGSLPNGKKKQVFVKVSKSSISIMSTAKLTKEWIEQIAKSVDVPLPGLNKGKKKSISFMQTKNRLSVAESVEEESAVDIQVLYKPKTEINPAMERTETQVDIPIRKCRSTEAILVKAKKDLCLMKKGFGKEKSQLRCQTSQARLVPSDAISKDDEVTGEKHNFPVTKSTIEAARSPSASPHKLANVDEKGDGSCKKSSLLKLIFDALEQNRGAKNVVESPPPPPPLFELDGKGIPRAQIIFRQPSFLTSVSNIGTPKSALFGSLEPDIENQLNALTLEDKKLLVKEYEACHRSSVQNRPLCHTVPKRFNSIRGQHQLYFPSKSQATPIYLRKWTEQFGNRRPPQENYGQLPVSQNRIIMSPRRQRPRNQTATGRKTGTRLPPLTMAPSKRPFTGVKDVHRLHHIEGIHLNPSSRTTLKKPVG